MKYTLKINQKGAVDVGIKNIRQAILFDFLANCSSWAEKEVVGGNTYYWVSRAKVCEELPLLQLKEDRVYRYFKQLEGLGLIEYIKYQKKDLILVTQKGLSYLNNNSAKKPNNNENSVKKSSVTQNSVKKSKKLGKNTEKNSVKIPTDNNTSIIITTKDNTKKRVLRTPKESIDPQSVVDSLESQGFFDTEEPPLFECFWDSDADTVAIEHPNRLGDVIYIQQSPSLAKLAKVEVVTGANKSNVKPSKKDYEQAFEHLWQQYPRKEGKRGAFRHFKASVKNPEDFERVQTALANYKEKIDTERVDPRFVKMGSTFFYNWEDYVDYRPVTQGELFLEKHRNLDEELNRRLAKYITDEGGCDNEE